MADREMWFEQQRAMEVPSVVGWSMTVLTSLTPFVTHACAFCEIGPEGYWISRRAFVSC